MNIRSDSPRLWTASYYPAFEGLRGLAATMVVFCHAGELLTTKFNWTFLFWGNDLFFVLSGFLITGILIGTRSQKNYFSTFYKRRALRIFPLYYTFFALLFLASAVFPLVWNRDLLTFCLYIGNLVTPIAKQNPTTIDLMRHGHRQAFMNLGPFWSLCVEEQFYLLWPIIIYYAKSGRQLRTFCRVVIPSTFALRIYIVLYLQKSGSPLFAYWSTYTRWDTLFFGAWLALYLRDHTLTRAQLRRYSVYAIVAGILLFLGPLHFNVSEVRLDNGVTTTIGLSAIALLCTGLVTLSLDDSSLFSRFLHCSMLRAIGRVSYGVYLFHALALPAFRTLAEKHGRYRLVFFAVDVFGTYLLAQVSFRWLESPFLRLKDRWAPQPLREGPQVPLDEPVLAMVEPHVTFSW